MQLADSAAIQQKTSECHDSRASQIREQAVQVSGCESLSDESLAVTTRHVGSDLIGPGSVRAAGPGFSRSEAAEQGGGQTSGCAQASLALLFLLSSLMPCRILFMWPTLVTPRSFRSLLSR